MIKMLKGHKFYLILSYIIFFCVSNSSYSGEVVPLQIIELPEVEYGFTCTGGFYDDNECIFYVGNIGKEMPKDQDFHSQIVLLSSQLDTVVETQDLYMEYPDMQDIQGITKDNLGRIWFCSCNEGKIRCIDESGKLCIEINWELPSGITFDSLNNTLIVIDQKGISIIDQNGSLQYYYSVKIEAQDQLCIDLEKQWLLITAGNKYNSDQYLYIFDLKTQKISKPFILKNSYAVEGICLIDRTLYVFNDGVYHNARIKKNYCSLYDYDEILSIVAFE